MISPIFKYIFSMIVGAIILIFFLQFAMKHAGTATAIEIRRFAFGFDDTLTAFSVAKDSDKDFDFPYTTKITFSEGKIGVISEGQNFSKPTHSIVYSPKKLDGKKISAWTRRWKFPFAITNFFYLSNDKTKYVLIHDTNTEDFVTGERDGVIEEIPKRFKAKAKKIGEAKTTAENLKRTYKDIYQARFIFFTKTERPTQIAKVKTVLGDKAYIVQIIPELDAGVDVGKIIFHNEGGEEAIYLGSEMMFGAIFAEDKDAYDYAFKQATNRLVNMTGMYLDKITLIERSEGCTNKYGVVETELNSLKNLALDQSENLQTYITRVKDLKDKNREVMGGGCPPLF